MSEFTLSQGAGQKLEFAVQRNGGTPEDIDYLSTGENFRTVTLLRTGKAKLVEVTETGREGAVIPTPPILTPPPGARLHTFRIRFNPNREWQEALIAGGPQTPNDYNVRKVGDQYPPTGTEEIEEDIILLNFLNGDSFDKALAWAQSKQLENTVPREVFAIGEQHPKLHEGLENPMYIVATEGCVFGGDRCACYVWWIGLARGAYLNSVEIFVGRCAWFAFRR